MTPERRAYKMLFGDDSETNFGTVVAMKDPPPLLTTWETAVRTIREAERDALRSLRERIADTRETNTFGEYDSATLSSVEDWIAERERET